MTSRDRIKLYMYQIMPLLLSFVWDVNHARIPDVNITLVGLKKFIVSHVHHVSMVYCAKLYIKTLCTIFKQSSGPWWRRFRL